MKRIWISLSSLIVFCFGQSTAMPQNSCGNLSEPNLLSGAGGKFVLIPGQKYTIGNSIGDKDAGVKEAWPVRVTLSPYYIAVTHTTKEQWDDVRMWGENADAP